MEEERSHKTSTVMDDAGKAEQNTLEAAKIIRSHQGYHEAEVSCGGEADLHKHNKRCQKNPGHSQFIPVKNFKLENLPSGYRDNLTLDYIKAEADLTCRLLARRTSENRPQYHPVRKHLLYPFSQDKGRHWMRTGTAYLAHMYPYREEDNKNCECHECCRPDTQTPKKVWGTIDIYSAMHVVFDADEARDATCYFGYDTSKTLLHKCVKLTGLKVEKTDVVEDYCMMKYVTHDMDIFNKLLEMLRHRCDLFNKMVLKYGSIYTSSRKSGAGSGINTNSGVSGEGSGVIMNSDLSIAGAGIITNSDVGGEVSAGVNMNSDLSTAGAGINTNSDVCGESSGVNMNSDLRNAGAGTNKNSGLSRPGAGINTNSGVSGAGPGINTNSSLSEDPGINTNSDVSGAGSGINTNSGLSSEIPGNNTNSGVSGAGPDVNTNSGLSRPGPVIIISHPHGLSKQITVGMWTHRKIWSATYKPEVKGWKGDGIVNTSYTYNAHTCPGSSGAPVIRLPEKGRWESFTRHHHSEGGKGNTNDNKSAVSGELISYLIPSVNAPLSDSIS